MSRLAAVLVLITLSSLELWSATRLVRDAAPAGNATVQSGLGEERAEQPIEQWNATSPDGRTTLSVGRHVDGRLVWRATRSGAELLRWSPMGVRRSDQDFTTDLKFDQASAATRIDESYRTAYGKRRDHRVRSWEMGIAFCRDRV
jgi:hypothetical protein